MQRPIVFQSELGHFIVKVGHFALLYYAKTPRGCPCLLVFCNFDYSATSSWCASINAKISSTLLIAPLAPIAMMQCVPTALAN